MYRFFVYAIAVLTVFTFGSLSIAAQTTAFTYQGRLTDGAQTANGTYQMQFTVYDADTGGTAQSATITNNAVVVTGGVFSVVLDFSPSPFAAGANRFLEIAVKKAADPGYTILTPRQPITSSPYSIRTLNAAAADSLSSACVGCITNAQINSVAGSKVTGTVANATNAATAATATTAGNVTGVVAIANGGTGSSTQNFVDTTTAQTVGGNKNLTGLTTFSGGERVQNLAADPEAASANNTGRVYYNTAINSLRFSNGTTWITAGQPVIYHVYNTAGRPGVTTTTLTLQPGMSQAITVPNGFTASVVVNSVIGSLNSVATANLFSATDFTVFLDSALLAKGGYTRYTTTNTTGSVAGFANSAISTAVNIGAGTHTFEIRTARSNGTVAVTIGGNSVTDVNAGEMTLTVYYTPATFVNRPAESGETVPSADGSGDNLRRKPGIQPVSPKQ